MTLAPCTTNTALYDTALFDDVPDTDRQQATLRAAALCALCPQPCEQKVTASQTVERRQVAVWSAMAIDLASEGRTTAQIADALCVDEATVLLLTASAPGRAA